MVDSQNVLMLLPQNNKPYTGSKVVLVVDKTG